MTDFIPKRFTLNDGISINEIHNAQLEHKFIIPSDYVYLLLHSNGLTIGDFQVSVDKKNPIVRIDDLVNLEWLINELHYDRESELDAPYRSTHLKIASTYSQDRVLIGNTAENLNQIFLFDYDNDRVVRICDSLFDFLKYHLI
jgi:hypothetical protein